MFGELFFLLEYRDQAVTPQYATGEGEGFSLPGNLFLIGTMNTADRSVALFDAALRRRFWFVPLYPDAEPVRGVLSRFLAAGGKREAFGWLAGLLRLANQRVAAHAGGRDLLIGPSHFLDDDLDTRRIRWAWEHAVLPFLEDNLPPGTDLAPFALKKLRDDAAAEFP